MRGWSRRDATSAKRQPFSSFHLMYPISNPITKRSSTAAALECAIVRCSRRIRGLHRDQEGTISIASVFGLLLLVMILGMVMNSTRQVDRKVKMQNAADATAWSGGTVIARSMNSLAFTNHLLFDVFALTAFLREGRDQNAVLSTGEILDHWRRVAPELANSEFSKFGILGTDIQQKVPYEIELVRSYSVWSKAAADAMLPMFEQILAEEMIPDYQRTLVLTTPSLVQIACDDVAQRHGQAWPGNPKVQGVLWRTIGDPVDGSSETTRRSLPVVDVVLDMEPELPTYYQNAVKERKSWSERYLRKWNNDLLLAFKYYGKMSRFYTLWDSFTCGQLQLLLEENAETNLPMQVRLMSTTSPESDQEMLRDYMFVGVVYADPIADVIPRWFRNPSDTESVAYAQVHVMVPRQPWRKYEPSEGGPRDRPLGGIPGEGLTDPASPVSTDMAGGASDTEHAPFADGSEEPFDPPIQEVPDIDTSEFTWRVGREYRWGGRSAGRDRHLTNQNWFVQLTPATCEALPTILSTPPGLDHISIDELPQYRNLTIEEFSWLSHH